MGGTFRFDIIVESIVSPDVLPRLNNNNKTKSVVNLAQPPSAELVVRQPGEDDGGVLAGPQSVSKTDMCVGALLERGPSGRVRPAAEAFKDNQEVDQ
ncbi:hypothetical protein EYF80_004811 [Liparis tanakae]|uniref:Uncharacterized protein n=1 Tax=Liparis tanakae TaxID=230148 RepID=A0A4Z2J3J2_9TELE|nr:hypothetical protein EYF80_004811 [Liparis tanakae]